jgi:uncharacterized protein YlxW (UPF0749 family)
VIASIVISPGADGGPVTSEQDPQLLARLADLERDVRQLRARVAALERLVGNAGEHSTDKAVVREKAVYDWQG